MPFPSLISTEGSRDWNVTRAAAYGAAIGAVAALFKTLSPLREAAGTNFFVQLTASIWEIVAATFAFALLCAGAAALRNFLRHQLMWSRMR
ncbi:MAG TPA: hypothetical protein VGJ20_46715 [Xanthobacteraceae bacterium]|jgi:hypothetical protein